MKTVFILPIFFWAAACAEPPAADRPPARTVEPAAATPVDEPLPEVPSSEAESDSETGLSAASAEEEPYRVGGDVLPPQRISGSSHSEELNALLRSGRFAWASCILTAVIDRQGKVEKIELLKPDKVSPEIEAAFHRMFAGWRFEPATRNGEPVAVHYHLVIHHCPLWPRDGEPSSSTSAEGSSARMGETTSDHRRM